MADEKYTVRLTSPAQAQVVFRVKNIYEIFLANSPHLRLIIRHLVVGKPPPASGPPDHIDGARVYFSEDTIYVDLTEDEDDIEDEIQVGPTGRPLTPFEPIETEDDIDRRIQEWEGKYFAENADAILRAHGYDPNEVGKRMQAVADRAFAKGRNEY